MTISLSRHLARFVVGLTYDAIPPEIVDKAKATTLHNISAALLGANTSRGHETARLIKKEESKADGATILVDGSKVTRMGAVFANSELMHITNQCDSYSMLTHPGPMVISSALATAEIDRKSGKEFLAAVVSGYEVQTRLAKNFIPTTQARGFRSSPIYGVFGAAATTAKLLDYSEDQIVTTIALAATSAAGTLETGRTGGTETWLHEPASARSGVMAALWARENAGGSETALEGDAGFYNAFTGNNQGKLSHVFTGPKETSLDLIVNGLGAHYEMINVTFKPYPTPGYNNPIVDLMASLKRQHNIDPDEVGQITVEVNWLEINYPSPAFPRPELKERRVGTIYYMVSYVCIEGSYPMHGRWYETGLGKGEAGERGESAKVLELMERVEVVGSQDRGFFSPRITIKMKDGASHVGEFTGQEFKWDFAEDVRRLNGFVPGLPITEKRFDELIEAIGRLEELPDIGLILQLSIPS